MAMQLSLAGSLRGSLRSSLQSINLVWKKERATLERTLQYFDESGVTIVLVWNHKRTLYEGTAEMSLGLHSGSLFISDQGLEPTHLFEVDKQEIGVVQEILLQINKDPVLPEPCHTPTTPTVPSMPPIGDSTPTDTDTLEQVILDHKLIDSRPLIEPLHRAVSRERELEAEPAALELTKQENSRLLIENRSLRQQCEQAKEEKQLIKQESFQIDEQLVAALESLSAYQQKQTLMDERYNAFTREARLMEEANQGMKLRINEMEIKAARDHESLIQMQFDLGNNSVDIQKMHEEREILIAKCNRLEQSLAVTERRGTQIQDIDRTLEKGRLEKETNILKENSNKMRDRDIPSLQQDIEELKQQLLNSNRRHQEQLENLQRELAITRGTGHSDGRKPIDQLDGADNERRNPIALMDRLSHHFNDCSASLQVLVQLLEATVEAKDSQLDRRSGELRDARIRNDKLVEEVVSRGHQISTLTDRIQSITSQQVPLQSTAHLIENIDHEVDPSVEPVSVLSDSSGDQGAKPVNITLPSPADLIKYEPGIKKLYRALPNITNKLIDFTDTPINVTKMNYLENPNTHIGNQVIFMIHGNYMIGTLKVVFQFRPSVSGLGALSPITYAGIEFNAPVGSSDGTFKGVRYFECRENCAEYTSLENVYIHV